MGNFITSFFYVCLPDEQIDNNELLLGDDYYIPYHKDNIYDYKLFRDIGEEHV